MENSIALLKIDHHGADIYKLGGKTEGEIASEQPYDPEHIHWHLHNKKVKNGKNNNEDTAFFKDIINDLQGFKGLVVASHGTGKANEGDVFIKYLEDHHKSLHQLVISKVETDEHETEKQLLAKIDEAALLDHLRK
ncbi:hypothetical protein [Flammeovirga sp. SubArs3]|uniref:hypothetical protein n=1 Tax=Flammeovirga sp. SubArs3 TaxID=2995316 RepID=UPI00248C4F44|nr:hypothetical protein [Flammeovirga sp. SubArs3]